MTTKPAPPSNRFLLFMSVCLPLGLLGIALLAELYFRIAVPEPQYDALFVLPPLNNYESCVETPYQLEIDSRDDKPILKIRNWPNRTANQKDPCVTKPRFFLFDTESKTNREIFLQFFKEELPELSADWTNIEIPEFKDWELSENSPDGYTFEIGNYRNRPSFLFFDTRKFTTPLSLYKQGKRISIPPVGNRTHFYIYSNQVKFLGWVIKKGDQ